MDPDRVIFVEAKNQRDILWCMEEALKCEGLAAVVCEIKEINFTESRRLQLAVEKSRVTVFIIRDQPRSIGVNACVSRWKSHLFKVMSLMGFLALVSRAGT